MGSAPAQETSWASAWLRDLRVAAGYTQEELAERSDLSVRSIRDLERGVVKRPRQESLRLIAGALDLVDDAADKLEIAFRGKHADTLAPLAATESAGRAQTQRTPAELPRDVSAFVGREPEVTDLDHLLGASDGGAPTTVVIYGPGGFGKSALAIHAAHLHAADFTDGQIFISLGGPRADGLTAAQAQFEILWALGVPDSDVPRSPSARTRFLRTLTATTRLLLVLDDAADASQVADLLPSGSGNATVTTARSPLSDLDSSGHIKLGPFDRRDSMELLAHANSSRPDPAACSRLAELCGDSPLALRISAARLHARPDWSASDLVMRLEQEQTRLAFLDYGVLGMRACLNVSMQALAASGTPTDELAQGLFTRLARLPGRDFAVETIAAVADAPLPTVEAAIGRLVDVQLLQARSQDRVSYHNLTLLYAREQPLPDGVEPQWQRLGTYYAASVFDLPGIFGNEPDDYAGLRWLADEPRSARGVFEWFRDEVSNISDYVKTRAAASEDEFCLCRFIVQSVWVLLENAKLTDVRDEAVQALYAAATRYDDPFTRFWCERQLAVGHATRGDLAGARGHLATAAGIVPELSDPVTRARGEAGLLSGQAIVSGVSGDIDAAIDDLRAALRHLSGRKLAHRSHCLKNLAFALSSAGRPMDALRYRIRLLETSTAEHNENGQILATLGIAQEMGALRKPHQAIRYARQALVHAEAAHIPRRIFDALVTIAEQSYEADLPDEAAQAHERARAVLAVQSPAASWDATADEKGIATAKDRFLTRGDGALPDSAPAKVPRQRDL
ncbi:MAG: helix-turn-helix domain-containing protein [Nocardioidaceae bacterium]